MRYKKKTKSKKSTKSKSSSNKKLSVALPTSSKRSKESPERLIKRRKLYNPDAMLAAFKAVKDNSISVHAAAKQFGVPLTTLRDRVDGRISLDAVRPGPPLLMVEEEEREIVHFLHTMAKYGYRYTRHEIAEIATDQAIAKGKRSRQANALTTKWVDNFISRWPSVRDVGCKFKSKTDAERTVRTYFEEIKKIIDKYRLLDKPDKIFNIMEISLSTDHRVQHPASIKSAHRFKAENVTNTTLLACASVSGRALAPFFVFQASQLTPDMMNRVPSNVNASISNTGNCSPLIFRRYLNEHFLPQSQRFDCEPILVLMDGSKSHMFVGMNEWGRANNVIFSFIPALTTHLLQPLEVECAEALKQRYQSVCERHLKPQAMPMISRNSVGELACQAYSKTMSRHVIIHSFKKAGVYPELSDDESGDELDSESYQSSFRSDDSNHEVPEEPIFTEDLVVGHNQEVTEEEVVTSNEIVLDAEGHPEEMVITSDGQLVLSGGRDLSVPGEGHLVIHGGEIFVNNGDNSLSQLQLVQAIPCDEPTEMKPDPDRLDALGDLRDGLIDHTRIFSNSAFDFGPATNLASIAVSCELDSSTELTEIKQEPCASFHDDEEDSFEENMSGAARTMPLSYLVRREANNENRRHSALLQRVLDIIHPK